jgi:hypothetical protein
MPVDLDELDIAPVGLKKRPYSLKNRFDSFFRHVSAPRSGSSSAPEHRQ